MRNTYLYYLAVLPLWVILLVSCRSGRSIPDSRYPDGPRQDRRVIIVDRDDDDDHYHKGRGRGHYEHGRGKGYGHRKHGDNRGVVAVRIRRPLIIIRTPDIIIGRYNDGRYYHRNPDGFIYWEGRDNRFYLDEQYLGRVEYNDNEYNEWRNRGDRNDSYNNKNRNDNRYYDKDDDRNDNRGRGHGKGKSKGHGKSKHD